eukprot:TRINITY_DN9973_c0_g1_i1.p1 TRINITY_DN9973_c0_g1~~TRINITY_DN9973_c0_g1_i1.p1  ORF type:complete len:373 (-),score=64.82 TRINITY_DN9973_c0_g1_i1:75-1193(-)
MSAASLYRACRDAQVSRALQILESAPAIDVNVKMEGGCTPLFRSCYIGSAPLVRALLARGANPTLPEENGITPLSVACVEGHVEVVEALLSAGAGEGAGYVVPMLAATQHNKPQVLRRLLVAGADPNSELDDEGASPLYVACELNHEVVVVLLLSHGADPNKSRAGVPPLVLAAQNDSVPIATRLLRAEAEVNHSTRDGATPLLIASQAGNLKMVQLLLANHADPKTKMDDGSHPLYVAAARGHVEVVRALLEAGADPNLPMKDGTTALHIACQQGNTLMAETLLDTWNQGEDAPAEKGAIPKGKPNVNVTRTDGITPLHIAARHGQDVLCTLLLVRGADRDAKCDGETALDVAQRFGRTKTIEALSANNSA